MAPTPEKGAKTHETVPAQGGSGIATPKSAGDPGITASNDAIRRGTEANAAETLEKLTVDASFDEIAERIPEVQAMIGMDQRNDYHCLTLDAHTKEFVRNLLEDPYIQAHPKRDVIALAGNLHDTGKVSPEGQQVHPKDPAKRQYIGHTKESARIAAEIIDKYFVGIEEEDKALIVALARLHGSALELLLNFTEDNQPKGKALRAYDDFLARVEAIPVDISLEDKMRIVFAFNRADRLARWDEDSPKKDPKVQGLKEQVGEQLQGLAELQKALPTMIEAVNKRRIGQRELDEGVPKAQRKGDTGAGIKYDEATGTYSVITAQRITPTAMDGEQVGLIMSNLSEIGVPKEKNRAFGKALREGGIPALEKAGFGEYIEAVEKLLAQ